MGCRNLGFVLAVVVGLLGAGFVAADEAEDRVIAALEDVGGKAYRDDTKPGNPVTAISLSPESTDAYIKTIHIFPLLDELYLYKSTVTDTGLKELRHFKKLTLITLTNTKVTDEGMKELALLPELTHLDLTGTEITDVGLREIAKIKTLKYLKLADTRVTDAGLKEIAKLSMLHQLDLGGTKVTDAGMKELAPLQWLFNLGLARTRVTDNGLKDLTKLKRIRGISLDGTGLTEAGLKELVAFKSLDSFGVEGPKFTDTALKELAKIPTLTYLRLTDTQATDLGIQDFKRSLPKCSVHIHHAPPARRVVVPVCPEPAKITTGSLTPSVFEVAPPPRLAAPKTPDELIIGKWKQDRIKKYPPGLCEFYIQFNSDGTTHLTLINYNEEIEKTGKYKLRDDLLIMTIDGETPETPRISVLKDLNSLKLTIEFNNTKTVNFSRIK